MSVNETHEKLVGLLKGQTVIDVKEGSGEAAICALVLSDGNTVTIHGNDLGSWVKVIESGGRFQSLSDLFESYLESDSWEMSFVGFDGGFAVFADGNKRRYEVATKYLSEWETKILHDPEGTERLKEAAGSGDIWTIHFSRWSGCPEHLCHPNDNTRVPPNPTKS